MHAVAFILYYFANRINEYIINLVALQHDDKNTHNLTVNRSVDFFSQKVKQSNEKYDDMNNNF